MPKLEDIRINFRVDKIFELWSRVIIQQSDGNLFILMKIKYLLVTPSTCGEPASWTRAAEIYRDM